jgi:ferritin-like metal-binding protein YciE
MHAISLEAAVNIKRTKAELVDSVILAAAAETEHHEIAVYEWLMCEAEAMENQEAVRLLQENLEQEQNTLKEVRQATRTVARDSTAKAA